MQRCDGRPLPPPPITASTRRMLCVNAWIVSFPETRFAFSKTTSLSVFNHCSRSFTNTKEALGIKVRKNIPITLHPVEKAIHVLDLVSGLYVHTFLFSFLFFFPPQNLIIAYGVFGVSFLT